MPSAKRAAFFGVIYLKLIKAACMAAVLFAFGMLCSCQRISSSPPGESYDTSRGITIYTSSASTTAEQSITLSEAQSQIPPQTGTVSNSTAPEITDISSAEEPVKEFQLPADFDERIAQVMEKYGCNQNCDPQSTPCGCQPELEAVVDEDGNIITPRDRVVSIYFMDMETGFEYTLNESVHYPVASTVKIPFAIFMYEKIDAGEIDPETVLTYEERHYFGGTGVIVDGDFGQQYTVAELLQLAITRSDNVAYEMLKDLTTWTDFEAYLREKGMTHDEDVRKSKQKICVESAGVDARLLAAYLTSDGKSVEGFKSDLLATRMKMIRSHYPVYRKYGWTDFSFHDIAYVDAPHPYILAILTNLDSGDDEALAMFRELSYMFEALGNPEAQE